MTGYSERIKPTDFSIRSYLEDLTHQRYQIPTFQRDVVWTPDSVKKLWDSIYRFYPIGSILIWKTDLKLHNHRSIGGHLITDDSKLSDFNYILDGQQRTTSLLTSLYGGHIEGREGFDPLLYIDLSIEDTEDIDENSYKQRFLFWNEIDDRSGQVKQNTPRMGKFQQGIIVKLQDIMLKFGETERFLHENGHSDFEDPIRQRLRSILDVLNNYRISFIELRGIEVSEVCQIFERINQEGKPLDIFDIVVAKTFRVANNENKAFYLRELIDNFRLETKGFFTDIPDIWYLEMLTILIMRNLKDTNIFNITPIYLNRIKTEQIESVWTNATKAFNHVFDLFENHLHLKGPRLIPNRYFFQAFASYFYLNKTPDYELLKKFFWFVSFHNDDIMNSSTSLLKLSEQLSKNELKGLGLDRFLINKERLRQASYNSKGRLSTAILALLANQEPRDWAQIDKLVLADVYYQLSDKPNLHHVFPVDFIATHPGKNHVDVNSLMNIAYIPQITNLQISNKNPIDYLRDYDHDNFDQVLAGHLISPKLLEWSREAMLPDTGLDEFIELRVNSVINKLQEKLAGIPFEVIDTKSNENDETE
ncbi:MAG: DUF262 domain-containing protein [Chloroflexi bacterium]|jgi:hypothetical protein|nr:DUF262 domain-containing protein [Chloroflexota bacterium]